LGIGGATKCRAKVLFFLYKIANFLLKFNESEFEKHEMNGRKMREAIPFNS